MPLPELSPLLAVNLICHDCGEVIKPKPVMANRGQKKIVASIEYVHINTKTGCSYRLESTQRISSTMIMLREDGSEARP